MKIQHKPLTSFKDFEADSAIFLFEDDKDLAAGRPDLSEFVKLLNPLQQSGEFKPSYLATLPLRLGQEQGRKWLLLIGLGDRKHLNSTRLLEAGGQAVRTAVQMNFKALHLFLPPLPRYATEQLLELMALGSQLALYRQKEFKTASPPLPSLKNLTFLTTPGHGAITDGKKILEETSVIAKYTALARDLINQPANVCYPESLAGKARDLARSLKIKAEVWDERALAERGLKLLAAVGQGSVHKPRLVELNYQGGPKGRKPTVLIGKGITFDSGGLSLKVAEGMENMKTDMAGAAAVLAVIAAAAELKLPQNICALLPLAENLPSGESFRPGDVVLSKAGLTVEIVNTDAEGRLILADALALAQEKQPELIIDLATLTGASVVALGEKCAAVFSNRENLLTEFAATGEALAENIWPMPLLDEYEEILESETADLTHAGTRMGGAVVAALFLRRFVDPQTPWIHLDIAGPARAAKSRPSTPKGATGFGIRTVLKFLQGAGTAPQAVDKVPFGDSPPRGVGGIHCRR